MPYIKPELRERLREPLKGLATVLAELSDMELDGAFNYCVSKLLILMYGSKSYRQLQRALGLMEAIKLEYYRRVAAPYEDVKIRENGDVYYDW